MSTKKNDKSFLVGKQRSYEKIWLLKENESKD